MPTLETLPINECWECSHCTQCCRGSQIVLDQADLQRLNQQHWERHPEFAHQRVIERAGLLSPRYRLAQRADKGCVFLTEQGRCRIHQEFGFDAKPLVCQLYPLQVVPVGGQLILTLRRSCPSAAADLGPSIREYTRQVRAAIRRRPGLGKAGEPPAILRGVGRNWGDTLLIADGFTRLLNDSRFPLVRRLVHGLQFCDLLEKCQLQSLDSSRLGELVELLVQAAPEESGDWFRPRRPPQRLARLLFRQVLPEYLRLDPRFQVRPSWRQRLRMLRVSIGFALGRGGVPALLPGFPQPRFDDLEQRALGPLASPLQDRLTRYYAAQTASHQYLLFGRAGWTLVERFRALALTFPVGMWTLRYFCGSQPPSGDDVLRAVTLLDRGQAVAPLAGVPHRRRITHLARLGELQRLCAWYAR